MVNEFKNHVSIYNKVEGASKGLAVFVIMVHMDI